MKPYIRAVVLVLGINALAYGQSHSSVLFAVCGGVLVGVFVASEGPTDA